MELEIGPFSRFENIENNAYWTGVSIDTTLGIDNYDVNVYKSHLNDCYNHPTTGLLANRQYISGKKMNYPNHAWRNIKKLEKHEVIDSLKKSIDNKLSAMYPNTRYVRQYIIDNDRVLLNTVKPKQKYTPLNKLMIACRKLIKI